MFNSDEFKKDFKEKVEDSLIDLIGDCGHKFKERFGRLKDDPLVACPVCGVKTRFKLDVRVKET